MSDQSKIDYVDASLARLFTAAPELFALAQSILDRRAQLEWTDPGNKAICEAAANVVAKVRGQTP